MHFRSILENYGIEFRPIPPRSPNLNPFAEARVGRTRAECFNWFIEFSEKHLRHLVNEHVAYYHQWQPYQSLGNLPPLMTVKPDYVECLGPSDVVCHERLGGLLRRYQRKAA